MDTTQTMNRLLAVLHAQHIREVLQDLLSKGELTKDQEVEEWKELCRSRCLNWDLEAFNRAWKMMLSEVMRVDELAAFEASGKEMSDVGV